MVERHKLEKTKKLLEDSKSIVNQLYTVAADDGELRKDEIELIKVIETSLDKFNALLVDILEDDVIDETEVEKLKAMEAEINDLVVYQAIEDGKISVPESELLNSLFDALKLFNQSVSEYEESS